MAQQPSLLNQVAHAQCCISFLPPALSASPPEEVEGNFGVWADQVVGTGVSAEEAGRATVNPDGELTQGWAHSLLPQQSHSSGPGSDTCGIPVAEKRAVGRTKGSLFFSHRSPS